MDYRMIERIPEHPGYGVTMDGRIWSCRNKKGEETGVWHQLSPYPTKAGYLLVTLGDGHGGKTRKLAHRLVARMFCPNPNRFTQVNHLNGERSDNKSSNLEWTNAAGNQNHAVATGARKLGEDHHNAKLSNKQVEEIIRRSSDGKVNFTSLGLEFGVHRSTIKRILVGETWAHSPARTHSRIFRSES